MKGKPGQLWYYAGVSPPGFVLLIKYTGKTINYSDDVRLENWLVYEVVISDAQEHWDMNILAEWICVPFDDMVLISDCGL